MVNKYWLALASIISACANFTIALLNKLPHWGAAVFLGLVFAWSAGYLHGDSKADKFRDAQIASIAANVKILASKGDVAELKAMVATLLTDKPSVTTGSVKPKK